MPSLADWEKDWQENPQRSGQPNMIPVFGLQILMAVIKLHHGVTGNIERLFHLGN
jgi:hypothetical protein